MGFYDNLAATSKKLLTKYGRDVVIAAITQGAYDPATSTAAPTSTSKTVKGVLFDINAGITLIQGTLVEVGDKRLLVESSGAPTIQDKVTVGDAIYRILSVTEINPGGTVVLYDLHLRK